MVRHVSDWFILHTKSSPYLFYSMPDIVLPESATATDESSSVPYGSLRDSNFAHPGFGFNRQDQMNTSRAAAMSSNFQPQSLPAFTEGGIGAYISANNKNNTTRGFNHSGSGIGVLLQAEEESRTDEVSGITEGCAGLQLNEDINQGGWAYNNTGTNPPSQSDNRGFGANDEDVPLSSSLTAIDLLTRIRQSPTSHKKAVNMSPNNTLNADCNVDPQLMQQQPQNAGTPTSNDNDDSHEMAFDFELDE